MPAAGDRSVTNSGGLWSLRLHTITSASQPSSRSHLVPDRLVGNLRLSCRRAALDAELFFYRRFDFCVDARVVPEDLLRSIPALGELASFVTDPRAALLQDFLL